MSKSMTLQQTGVTTTGNLKGIAVTSGLPDNVLNVVFCSQI